MFYSSARREFQSLQITLNYVRQSCSSYLLSLRVASPLLLPDFSLTLTSNHCIIRMDVGWETIPCDFERSKCRKTPCPIRKIPRI